MANNNPFPPKHVGVSRQGADRRYGDMESPNRNLKPDHVRQNVGVVCNCKWAGCAQLAGSDGYYCERHAAERMIAGAELSTPKHVVRHDHFGGESHNVSYDTRPGKPEGQKNKI